MADYELYLTDDTGRRISLLAKPFFLTYTRVVSGLGTLNFGMSMQDFSKDILPYFRPDWRVEVWRSAAKSVPMRREDVFMLRKPNVYTRDDNVNVIQFYGRNGVDLLMRRSVVQRGGSTYANKTTFADDMMKAIVTQQMLYGSALNESGVVDNTRAWPQNEFLVQANQSLGPSISREFSGRNVYDILKDIKDATFQLNVTSSANKRIHFDVVGKDLTGITTGPNSPLGWEFQTFASLRGSDRTGGIEFSLENENIRGASYSISHLDEVNAVFVFGNGTGDAQLITSVLDSTRIASSRWNMSEKVLNASSEASTTALQDAGRAELYKGKPVDEMLAEILNTPGGPASPRSLYGVDWDLGDRVRVNYAKKQFNMEINIVYVSVDESGKETITGRSTVQ